MMQQKAKAAKNWEWKSEPGLRFRLASVSVSISQRHPFRFSCSLFLMRHSGAALKTGVLAATAMWLPEQRTERTGCASAATNGRQACETIVALVFGSKFHWTR